MKKKFLVFLFMILVATLARAQKTYVKDSDQCHIQDHTFNVNIRSENFITSSEDDAYGEFIELRKGDKYLAVKTPDSIRYRYKLFEGASTFCNKTLSMRISATTYALFLLKDNRPFPNTLMIMYLNTDTKKAEIVGTKINSDSGFPKNGKMYFRQASEKNFKKFGSTLIHNKKYNFEERMLEPWLSFDGKDFVLDHEMTYQMMEEKRLLKRSDLLGLTAFTEFYYKKAVDPKTGSVCVSLNNEDWKCNQ